MNPTAEQLRAAGWVEKSPGKWGKLQVEPDSKLHNSDQSEDEGQLQDDVIAYCWSRGWWVDYSRMDRKTTRPLGAPDLIVWADMGRVWAVECKTRLGKLRPEQIGIKMMLEHLGHKYVVVRSLQEFIVCTNDSRPA